METDKGIELIDSMFDESTSVDPTTMAFVRGLMEESDRGCVLLGAAFLNDEVETLLRAAFLGSNDIIDPLFKGGSAPLGSFWAKTKLALAMGLISANTYDVMDKIRDLRNKFAHKAAPVSLSDERVAPILKKLEPHLQKICKAFRLVMESRTSGNNIGGDNGDTASSLAHLQISIHKVEFALVVSFCEAEISKSRVRALKEKKSA